MTTDNTLKAGLELLSKPDEAHSSGFLAQTRDELDISGAQAAYDELDGRRAQMLLTASDSAISKIEGEMQTALRDIERRKAVAQALRPLIEQAQEREAKASIERLGVRAREVQADLAAAYVKLSKGADQVIASRGVISAGEPVLANINDRLRAAGRPDLMVEMPLNALPRLSGIEWQFWSSPLNWTLDWPGYTHEPAGYEGAPIPKQFIGKRKYEALAELLPGGKLYSGRL